MKRKPIDVTALRKEAGLPPPEHAANGEPDNPHYRPGRARKVPVTAFFEPDVRTELRRLALDRGTTLQALMAEAINDVFAKYGRPEIAKS